MKELNDLHVCILDRPSVMVQQDFFLVNMIVKKERHGSCSRDTSHTLQRRLLTLHKPTEQKLIDDKTIFLKDYLDTRSTGHDRR